MPVSSSELNRLFCLTSRSQTYKPQLDALNRIFKAIKPSKYLEIGAFEGRSLLLYSALASLYLQSLPLHVTSIDSWLGGDEHKHSSVPMKNVEVVFDEVAESCNTFLIANCIAKKSKSFRERDSEILPIAKVIMI